MEANIRLARDVLFSKEVLHASEAWTAHPLLIHHNPKLVHHNPNLA
jgi:hypothetical protein